MSDKTFYHVPGLGRLVPILLSITLAGCGTTLFKDSSPAYTRSKTGESLEIPPDLTKSSAGENLLPEVLTEEPTASELKEFERFVELSKADEYQQFKQWKAHSPEKDRLDFRAFVAARKAAREGGREGAGVTLNRLLTEERQISIRANQDTAFQIVDAALTDMAVEVLLHNTENYEFRVKLPQVGRSTLFSPNGDRFFIRLERDGSTTLVSLFRSSRRKSISESSTEFMKQFATRIRFAKVKLEMERTVVSSESLPGELQTTASGHLELELEDVSGEKLWRTIDYIADQVGFTVVERVPEEGKFIVKYSTDEDLKEKSALQKLAFWNRDGAVKDGDLYSIEILPGKTRGSRIRITTLQGEMNLVGDKILELLRANL